MSFDRVCLSSPARRQVVLITASLRAVISTIVCKGGARYGLNLLVFLLYIRRVVNRTRTGCLFDVAHRAGLLRHRFRCLTRRSKGVVRASSVYRFLGFQAERQGTILSYKAILVIVNIFTSCKNPKDGARWEIFCCFEIFFTRPSWKRVAVRKDIRALG